MKILLASQEPGASRGLVPVAQAAMDAGHIVQVVSRQWGTALFRSSGCAIREIQDNMGDDVEKSLVEIEPDVVLTGLAGAPGQSLDLEMQRAAKKLRVPRTALLDASMYYRDRVAGPRGEPFYYLPDKIFVLNDFTRQEMLAEGFPPASIVVTGQPVYDYLALQRNNPRPSGSSVEVVFFSEGLAKESRRRPEHDVGYDEDVVVPLLIDILKDLASNRPIVLTIKRHPKEETRDRIYRPTPGLTVRDVLDTDSVELMLKADLVCGMSSSLLLEAWLAGKAVVSLQPGLTSWNRLVLCRAGIIDAALNRDQAIELIKRGLKGERPSIIPQAWCPMIGKAASAIVNELIRSVAA